VATLLAQLCCHRNQLPQGAPSSPIITNYICRALDAQLARLAQAERCHYTRYADDLCFSTDRKTFPSTLASVSSGRSEPGQALLTIINDNGFNVNAVKTRLIQQTRRQRVTGLVVNERVNVTNDYVRSLRMLLYIWRQYGEKDAQQAMARFENSRNRPPAMPPLDFKRAIRGRVQYVGSVKGWSNQVYVRLAEALERVDPTFRPRTRLTLEAPQQVKIYTEGKTDPLHLQAALSHFQSKGEFEDLQLEFPHDADSEGDAELLKKCQGLAMSPQEVPCVCVFDRDNDKILRQAEVGSAGYKEYGNGVAAIAIVPPPWRKEPLCIEMLYTDDDLRRRDGAGRRLYLGEEFNRTTGHHGEERVNVPMAQQRTLVREEVYSFDGGKSVGLSKADFARCVTTREGEFAADLDFGGFRATFELMREVVARLAAKPPVLAGGSGKSIRK
jgi:RNA-directed DNA polymerase